jgi:ABC-type spermidine/putrescine transport system permease subunit I
LVLPASAVLLVFFVVPVALLVIDGVFIHGVFTLAAYRTVLTDPYYAEVLWRSIWLSVISTAICIVLGYPVAFYVTRLSGQRHKRYVYMAVLAPLFTSAVIRAIAWMMILGNRGVLNTALTMLGVIETPMRLLYSNVAIITGLVYTMIPFAVLTIAPVLEILDTRLEEAARDLGASPLQTYVRVTLPLSVPGTSAAAILVFALCLSSYVIPSLLGGGRIKVLASLIFEQFLRAFNWPLGSALACMLLVVTGVVILGYGRLVGGRLTVGPGGGRAA